MHFYLTFIAKDQGANTYAIWEGDSHEEALRLYIEKSIAQWGEPEARRFNGGQVFVQPCGEEDGFGRAQIQPIRGDNAYKFGTGLGRLLTVSVTEPPKVQYVVEVQDA